MVEPTNIGGNIQNLDVLNQNLNLPQNNLMNEGLPGVEMNIFKNDGLLEGNFIKDNMPGVEVNIFDNEESEYE